MTTKATKDGVAPTLGVTRKRGACALMTRVLLPSSACSPRPHAAASHRTTSVDSQATRSSIGSAAPSAVPAACRARNSTSPGKWPAVRADGLAAVGLSISPAATDCSGTSCCCWTTRLPPPWWWTRGSRVRLAGARRTGRRLATAGGPRAFRRRGRRQRGCRRADDVVVSMHACGSLTDVVLAQASAARARWPCCRAATISRPATPVDWRGGWTAPSPSTWSARCACDRTATTCGRRPSRRRSRRRTACCSAPLVPRPPPHQLYTLDGITSNGITCCVMVSDQPTMTSLRPARFRTWSSTSWWRWPTTSVTGTA